MTLSGFADFTLRPDIAEAFKKSGAYSHPGDAMSKEDPRFIDYVVENWRDILNDIECLPPIESERASDAVRFNSSVITLGLTCQHLQPEEYVEFFDQILTLHEQKKISVTAVKNIYSGGDKKRDFWSVNWEHSKVKTTLSRMKKLIPTTDKAFSSMLDDQASGKLADNYMINLSDDAPLPETLPGIKLQRPWASAIRKYEKLTGKKVPPDPNFPDHNNTRPSKAGLSAVQASDPNLGQGETWNSWKWVALISSLLILTFLMRKLFSERRTRWGSSAS